MARGVNKVILVGSLGKDPEIRYLPSGGAVANFSMATSEQWKDKQTGEKKEKTEWHRIVIFGKVAEIAGEYLRKGSQVYIEGKLQTREWEKDGVKRYSTEIVASDMQMLGGRSGGSDQGYNQQRGQSDQQSSQAPACGSFDDFDDDIPFR